MFEQEFFVEAVAAFHEAFAFLQHAAMSSSSFNALRNHSQETSVAVGVAITAVAGVAVAAAVGGTLLYSRRSPFNGRKRKRSPLTQKQWCDAFDSESGRLVNHHKVLKKIRFGVCAYAYLQMCFLQAAMQFCISLNIQSAMQFQCYGIDPSIRAEVWLFLLGFYELDSTREEREAEKCRKREVYRDLKIQCNILRENIFEESPEGDGRFGNTETGSEGSSSPSAEKQNSSRKVDLATDNAASAGDSSEENTEDYCKEGLAKMESTLSSSKLERADLMEGCLKATEDFITWQRIIRLDAVRMNAEWVPYSPTQANVTQKVAWELAMSVGLKDDEHLEPCRQHHAARLVGILEAYALYDPETGYCQGMSDLLSPFVALLDEDHEAFWCFAQFMNSARHNFRLDEVGIRRQLSKISSIFKAGDPHLYSHLESIHAQDFYFVYRMVVVLLRRELTFEQTISLWEVIWAEKRAMGMGHTKTTSWRNTRRKTFLTDDLILFVIAAAVHQRRKTIIEKCKGMDEILRECNSMAGHLDVWTLLDIARELVSAVHGRIPD